jgi:hypothetical protein
MADAANRGDLVGRGLNCDQAALAVCRDDAVQLAFEPM